VVVLGFDLLMKFSARFQLAALLAFVSLMVVARALMALEAGADGFAGCYADRALGPSTLRVVRHADRYVLLPVGRETPQPWLQPGAAVMPKMRLVQGGQLRAELEEHFGASVGLMAAALVNAENLLHGPVLVRLQSASASLDLNHTSFVLVSKRTVPLFPRECDDVPAA
jgi:hypothetical protein